MRKEKIKSIDFIKGICAIGILLFHFESHYTSRALTFVSNYFDAGAVVTVFFMVSGALLQYHYSQKLDLKEYYIKRWKGIYPMFYLAYIPCWILNVLRHGAVLYNGPASSYLYTFLGIDGYLAQRVDTYYILGEWFLGAIIALYLVYPLLRWLFVKNKWVAVAGALALYLVFYDQPITNANAFWSISSCLISFTLGMFLLEFRKQIVTLPAVSLAALGYILLSVLRVPMPVNAGRHLLGICLFVLLFALGEKVMARPRLERVFVELGKLSYPIFLVHHVILWAVLQIWQPVAWWQIGLLAALVVAVVLVVAKVLAIITNFVLTKFQLIWSKGRNNKPVLEK